MTKAYICKVCPDFKTFYEAVMRDHMVRNHTMMVEIEIPSVGTA